MKRETEHIIKLMDVKYDFVLLKANTQNKRNAKRTDLPTIQFCNTLVFIPPRKIQLTIYKNENTICLGKNKQTIWN